MEYINNSYALYSISKLGQNYYVRPQVKNEIPINILNNYNSNSALLYSFGGTFKIYSKDSDNDMVYDKNSFDVSKEIGDFFLNSGSKPSVFIGVVSDIINQIRKIYFELTKQDFPYNINIEFCDNFSMEKKYKEHTNENWTLSIRGFSVNSNDKFVYVLYDTLINMMLTLGHEIGHILTPSRHNKITEEAKAYAFEIMWISKIKELNILSLSEQIDLSNLGSPKANGIHDVAFSWVNSFLMDGKSAKEIYDDITKGELLISS